MRTSLSPPTQVIGSAFGHPTMYPPRIDVAVNDIGELDGGRERHEGVEGTESVPTIGDS